MTSIQEERIVNELRELNKAFKQILGVLNKIDGAVEEWETRRKEENRQKLPPHLRDTREAGSDHVVGGG